MESIVGFVRFGKVLYGLSLDRLGKVWKGLEGFGKVIIGLECFGKVRIGPYKLDKFLWASDEFACD